MAASSASSSDAPDAIAARLRASPITVSSSVRELSDVRSVTHTIATGVMSVDAATGSSASGTTKIWRGPNVSEIWPHMPTMNIARYNCASSDGTLIACIVKLRCPRRRFRDGSSVVRPVSAAVSSAGGSQTLVPPIFMRGAMPPGCCSVGIVSICASSQSSAPEPRSVRRCSAASRYRRVLTHRRTHMAAKMATGIHPMMKM
mmetsp:Transcript_20371/g.63294  ORF Transcript_20371/g.63294 Transcript_20371/m.63294 type:complete len:202 (-) Transcript_20371:971-1576(-)